MAIRVSYNVPQPTQPPDGNPVYTKVEIERAPDNGSGAPGAWTNIATVTIDPDNSYAYSYEDDAGAVTSWYRHRYTNAAVSEWSDYSTEIQTNDFWPLQQLRADIPDADILDADWDDWMIQTMLDLWTEGIWLPHEEPILIELDSDDLTEERYDIPATLFEVCRVEQVAKRPKKTITDATNATPIVVTSVAHGFSSGDTVLVEDVLGNTTANGAWVIDRLTADTFSLRFSAGTAAYTSGGSARKSGTRHIAWLYSGVEWAQRDRQIRLIEPSTAYDYVLHGKRRFRDISELREEHFMLVYWMTRQKYLDKRVRERSNTRQFKVLDRLADITTTDLREFFRLSNVQVERRLGVLRPEEYPVDLAMAAEAY